MRTVRHRELRRITTDDGTPTGNWLSRWCRVVDGSDRCSPRDTSRSPARIPAWRWALLFQGDDFHGGRLRQSNCRASQRASGTLRPCMPRYPRTTRPCCISCGRMCLAVLIGMAKQMPWAGDDSRVDADHPAAAVDQRAAAVARVQRGVGLDHVVDQVAVMLRSVRPSALTTPAVTVESKPKVSLR